MSNQPFLTKEEELGLLEIAHFSNDEKERIEARNELVMRNIRLIFLTVKKTRRHGFTVEECMSVAVDAFMYSISRFDFRDVRLSTYAVTAIKHKVSRWASEQRGVLSRVILSFTKEHRSPCDSPFSCLIFWIREPTLSNSLACLLTPPSPMLPRICCDTTIRRQIGALHYRFRSFRIPL